MAATPFQKPGLPRSMGLTRQQCEKEAWAIAPDGRRYHGGASIIAALAWAIGNPALAEAYYLPGLRQVVDAVYAWTAAHRARLPGVTPYCQAHPNECGQE